MQNSHPTPYLALNGLLHEWVSSTQTILGDKLTGAYLQGSLAIGDFDEHSDIDFLAVIEEKLTDAEREALQVMHAQIHGLGGRYRPDYPSQTRILAPDHWETSLEGSYVPRNLLKSHKSVGTKHWYLDNGSTVLERADHDDTLVVRWTVRERGIVLTGPDPKSLIDPVPTDALRREVLATMRHIVAEIDNSYWTSLFGQPFAVLTFCRMLHTLETGEIHSKRASALWGQAKLDPHWAGLIQRAWDTRGHGHVSQPADPDEYQTTLGFIDYALAESTRHQVNVIDCTL